MFNLFFFIVVVVLSEAVSRLNFTLVKSKIPIKRIRGSIGLSGHSLYGYVRDSTALHI